MLLTTLAAIALSAPSLSQPPQPAWPGGATAGAGHGKLEWFEGTWPELLAEAKKTDKVIFIDFWTTWCGYCKKLDRETFSDDAVAGEMKKALCFSVDAESEMGRPLAKQFGVGGFPALVWLDPDGERRDLISGFLPAEGFLTEARRIIADEGTIGSGLRRLETEPNNHELRFDVAQRLRKLGDQKGHDAQMAALRKADPEGKSLPMRRVTLMAIFQDINTRYAESGGSIDSLDSSKVKEFLGAETHGELLFLGWIQVHRLERFKASEFQRRNIPIEAKATRAAARMAAEKAFGHCPANEVAPFGHMLARSFYEESDELEPREQALALRAAQQASAAAPEDVTILDTLACCLFMTGQREEAIEMARRCTQLEPENLDWKNRLREFEGKP